MRCKVRRYDKRSGTRRWRPLFVYDKYFKAKEGRSGGKLTPRFG